MNLLSSVGELSLAAMKRTGVAGICVEKDKKRLDVGVFRTRKDCGELDLLWKHQNYMDADFFHWLKGNRKFRAVISNPDFEVALETLTLALLALDTSHADARCVFLLPSDFFESHIGTIHAPGKMKRNLILR